MSDTQETMSHATEGECVVTVYLDATGKPIDLRGWIETLVTATDSLSPPHILKDDASRRVWVEDMERRLSEICESLESFLPSDER